MAFEPALATGYWPFIVRWGISGTKQVLDINEQGTQSDFFELSFKSWSLDLQKNCPQLHKHMD